MKKCAKPVRQQINLLLRDPAANTNTAIPADKQKALLSKIYGLILAREVVQACDRVPFPWHRRYGIRRIV